MHQLIPVGDEGQAGERVHLDSAGAEGGGHRGRQGVYEAGPNGDMGDIGIFNYPQIYSNFLLL